MNIHTTNITHTIEKPLKNIAPPPTKIDSYSVIFLPFTSLIYGTTTPAKVLPIKNADVAKPKRYFRSQ